MSIKEVLQNKLLKIGGIKMEEKLIPYTINIYLMDLENYIYWKSFLRRNWSSK